MNRVAAPISPELAPEAPTSGMKSIGDSAQWARAAAIRGDGHEDEKSRRAEAARDRRAEGEQPDGVEQDMRPGPVQEGVGQDRPNLRAAAERLQLTHGPNLIESGGIGIGADQKVDCARGPERNGQSSGRESEFTQNKVLNLGRQG